MTNWTDLIDTDPVGAYHKREEWLGTNNPPHLTDAELERDDDRLLSNFAALCEELSLLLWKQMQKSQGRSQDVLVNEMPEKLRHQAWRNVSSRFPEVE